METKPVYDSGIYTGAVRHRRFSPKTHEFNYQLFMVYFNTQKIDEIYKQSPFWSSNWWSPARFKRSDFHITQGDDKSTPRLTLDLSVRETVKQKSGVELRGPIRALGNWRYWGYNMNPITTYYCFNEADTQLVALLIEVHNTPWNERMSYVITELDGKSKQQFSFSKAMHVSPFNPLDMTYQWQSTTPQKTLALHIENWKEQQLVTDATLTLHHNPISTHSLNSVLIQFPLMTVKVIAAIYWQACKLWFKRVPVFNHHLPKESNNIPLSDSRP